jgi:26S proteasome regulatory subunit N13
MYSDLFDHLGSGGSSGGGSSSSTSNSNEKQLVSFKAGKMELTLQENGNYYVTPDTRRGEIRIVWKISEQSLYWEWYDRREKRVDDKHLLHSVGGAVVVVAGNNENSTNSNDLGTMERVMNVPNAAPQDRLYVWSRPSSTSGGSTSNKPEYRMYWMQDASDEKDDEIIAKVNQYLLDPASANPTLASTTTTITTASTTNNNNENQRTLTSSSSRTTSRSGVTATIGGNIADRQQVDALSNILENLGMPQNESTTTTNNSNNLLASSTSGSTTAPRSGGAGTLTLADLQGAMAGLQQQAALSSSGGGPPGPPLQELVTPAAISSLLENQAVRTRLLEFLPEEQRSPEFLEENLRSPQVQQTLRSLTAALLPDDTGSMDGFHSVLANFNMAEGAQEALQNNSNNPIQAFLECVLKSVEKEGKDDEEEKMDEDESKE